MTYPPQSEPFTEALGGAAQTPAMAYRLVMAISDAVRRAAEKHLTSREEELGEDAEKTGAGRPSARRPRRRPSGCAGTGGGLAAVGASATSQWPDIQSLGRGLRLKEGASSREGR